MPLIYASGRKITRMESVVATTVDVISREPSSAATMGDLSYFSIWR